MEPRAPSVAGARTVAQRLTTGWGAAVRATGFVGPNEAGKNSTLLAPPGQARSGQLT